MVEIIPAIMPDSFNDLLQKAERVKGIVPRAQIDVMDGKFVPSVSWPYDEEGISQFKSMVKNGEMLPFWDEIDYEIDLMVENPEDIVEDWVALGARRIIVHIKSTKKLKEIITLLENACSEEEDFICVPPIEFGIALGAKTTIDALTPYMHDVDVVQFMGIKKIGYQGEPFDESVTGRIESLREEYPHLIISVDGGVSFETAPKLIKAGATRLVSGSTIFNSPDIRATISKLRQEQTS
ncbi:ribulose-phosphate 3-epimerase [candidate division KSB1 bacterium]